MARRRRRRRSKNPVKRWAANRMRRGKLDEVKLLIIIGWTIYRLFAWAFFQRTPAPSEVAKLASNPDKFYNSFRWKALRFKTLVVNRKKYGRNTCEVCHSIKGPWHCDHINPRSTHPEQALDEDNARILCEACNVGRSDDYQEDDEPNERKAA